jgi:protein arginine kinase activator
MLCDECKKNQAKFHSIKKINGVTTEKHLCGDCQQKLAVASVKFAPLSEDFFSGFKNLFGLSRRSAFACSVCGTTDEEFLSTGMCGCANCYKDLEPVIMPVIQRVQSDTRHTGKSLSGIGARGADEYERLRRELDEAVRTENYERAYVLQGKLKKLKEE